MSVLPSAHMPSVQAYADAARAYPALWRTGLGLLCICVIYLLFTGLGFVAWTMADMVLRGQAGAVDLAGQLSRPVIAAVLASLAVLIPATWAVLRLLHKRDLRSVLGPGGLDLRAYALGTGVVLAIAAGLAGLSALTTPISPNTPLATIALWFVPVSLLLILQTAGEEIVFRGYLQQQLSARFRAPLMWWILPSILFGALHYDSASFGPNAWLPAAAAFVMGLILGDVTARTGNLSAAMGMHFANNLVALFLLSFPSALSAFAAFTLDLDLGDTDAVRASLVGSVAVLVVLYAAYLAVLAWRAR